MELIEQLSNKPTKAVSNEQYWNEHIRLKQESGLSRIAYCRLNELICSRFAYWENKLKLQSQPTTSLLAVKLSSSALTISQPNTLCSLAFKGGHELKIHDQTVLPLLLSLFR